MESVIFPGEEDEEVIFRADCKLWKLAPWRKSIVMSRQCGPAQYPLPGQGMSWRRAKVRGAGEGDEQKLLFVSAERKQLAGSQPLAQTRLGYGTSSYLFFFLSSTKYKMQDPIEVPLLPIVAETVSHTMYCRAGGGKSEVVVLLEPYSPLSTSNDVWLHQGLPHSWTMINSSHDMAYSSFCDSMCSVGAHQQAQDHRSRSFGNAHARRLEAAAEHAHLSKYKVCLSFKAWQVYWTSDDFPITAPKVHFSWSLKVRKSWREICALCRCGYWRVWQGHAQSTKFSEHKSPAFWLLPNCNIFACTITSSPSLVILYIPLL